jgi:hypothetical protein
MVSEYDPLDAVDPTAKLKRSLTESDVPVIDELEVKTSKSSVEERFRAADFRLRSLVLTSCQADFLSLASSLSASISFMG